MCVSLVAVVKGGGAGGGWVGGSTAGKSGLSAAWIRRVAQKHLEKNRYFYGSIHTGGCYTTDRKERDMKEGKCKRGE
jgi:hypothetical protein